VNERLNKTFAYEQCDVPQGVSLAEWGARQAPPSRRRAQLTSGMLAAVATLVPMALSVRGSRHR
jgi:hypothetical protein